MLEYFFYCPYCFSSISMLVDPSITTQKYIEDCEVCCRPIEVNCKIEDNEIVDFYGISIDQ